MPKTTFNTLWIKNYKEFNWDGDVLFCSACSKIIRAEKKFIVDQHVKTALHIENLKKQKSEKGASSHQTIKSCLKEKSKIDSQKQFNEDLCKGLIGANIPINKLNNSNFRSFLSKYCKFNIPDESTLRKGSVDSIYEETRTNIKELIGKSYFYVVVDETTDSRGRYIAHALIGVLNGNNPGKSFLFASKQLEKTNNLTITRFVQDSLTNFFLPDAVPTDKFILFLTDAARYMVRAGTNLRIFYPYMLHVTCLAHGINRVAECVREQFPMVNDLINYIKKVFLKAPTRIQFYKEKFPNLQLPPQPILTRWGTWLEAALFYAENYESIKEVVEELDDKSCTALTKSRDLLQNTELRKHLLFIKSNYAFMPSIIEKLENTSLALVESISLINEFRSGCEAVKGEIGATVLKKFVYVMEKNTDYEVLVNISRIFAGEFGIKTGSNLRIDVSDKFKYAPITSVDVERSFSVFKHMFTDRRHNFLLENFEKHLIVNCFHNLEYN